MQNKIGFITNYDRSTLSNYNIASYALPQNSYSLLGNDATRIKLLEQLQKDKEASVFIFTHGEDDSFTDNNGSIAYSVSDTQLENRIVFVYACFTANDLARKTANQNTIYWGYTGVIAALEDNEESKDIFIKIISDVLNNFSSLTTESDINDYLEKLKDMCDKGQEKLDILTKDDSELDSMECYKSLMHIWSRLRVYLKSDKVKITHPNANSQDLFKY